MGKIMDVESSDATASAAGTKILKSMKKIRMTGAPTVDESLYSFHSMLLSKKSFVNSTMQLD